ncbi:MAG: flap endonuclease [Polyangiaceae bacterium]|nr:flap endonuclease [Polyangiaceae bacterium]
MTEKLCVIDGTFELFRAYFGAPSLQTPQGEERGAVVGLGQSLLSLIESGEFSHLGIAFDSVIESFRNDLYEGYKTGEGIEEELVGQFAPAEEMAAALGLRVFPMIRYEADDALASLAAQFSPKFSQVVIASPDKDLRQCVDGDQVISWDRMRKVRYDEQATIEKVGVAPSSIPDWLALVGDTADGIPGVVKWGAKSASKVLAHYLHLESIPPNSEDWEVQVRGASGLCAALAESGDDVFLWRKLARLVQDVDLKTTKEELRWRVPPDESWAKLCETWGASRLLKRAEKAFSSSS